MGAEIYLDLGCVHTSVYICNMLRCAHFAQTLWLDPGTKRSPVQFLVRTHAQFAGLIPPVGGVQEAADR